VLIKQLKELDNQILALQRKRDLLLSVADNDKLEQTGSELIYDFEDIIYCNTVSLTEKLKQLEEKTIIAASLGASPKVNEFLQKLIPCII
jgi:flagellar motor switch protein FliG